MSSNTERMKQNDKIGIQKLPVKLTDDNQNNFILTTNPFPQPTNNPLVLNYYLNSTNEKTVRSQITNKPGTFIDTESEKGCFGWELLGQNLFIPYILRDREKYCALRMVDKLVLNRYLHKEIFTNCIDITSYYITETECKLLNEVNFLHCDTQFGCNLFTTQDLIIKFSDVSELYKYQNICYCKLRGRCSNLEDKIGFIRIDGTSVIPFVIKNNIKYMPLFYFEMLSENQKQYLNLDVLRNWDLAYMKFLFTLQGIRKDLFNIDTCTVVDLEIIKRYFPPNIVFEYYKYYKCTLPLYLLQEPWKGDLITYPKL